MEFLIPLLFFAIPVAAALLDKRAKDGKGQARPADTVRSGSSPAPERPLGRPFPSDSHPLTTEEAAPRPVAASQAGQEEEGIRMIKRQPRLSEETSRQARKLEIDKKKLILYSEILKPKFDR